MPLHPSMRLRGTQGAAAGDWSASARNASRSRTIRRPSSDVSTTLGRLPTGKSLLAGVAEAIGAVRGIVDPGSHVVEPADRLAGSPATPRHVRWVCQVRPDA